MYTRPSAPGMAARWLPPAAERALGLEFYATATPGVGGQLKERPESFQVRELSRFPRPEAGGAYAVLTLRSRNWEQHELGQRLAQRLGLPPHAISWAGTKDRRAVAERLASYRGPLPPAELGIPGVELLDAYPAREGLALGYHYGNAFAVRLDAPVGEIARLDATRDALRSIGGFPNLFGPQRFGEVRPITHRVGQLLVQGRTADAVEAYLAEVPPDGTGRGDEARRAYAAHHDAARALREFPPEFRFERTMLDHLARGQGPERALRALSRELRTLFVHAYQALVFNRLVSRRVAEGLPLGAPVEGDHLLRVGRDGTVSGREPVPVAADNLPEARAVVASGRALVGAPLVGYATPLPEGRPGALLASVLAEEGIDRFAFRLPTMPDLASAGTFRPLLVPLPPIDWRPDPADGAGEGATPPTTGWWFRFALPKGAYATVLMREFQKSGATRAT